MAKKTRSASWVKSLVAQGLKYEVVVLETFITGDTLYEAEQFWISYFRFVGANLTNLADGGPGSFGSKWSTEARKRLSDRLKGRVVTPEQRARISKTLTGRKASEETKKKLRAIRSTPEARKRNAEARGARPVIDQHGAVYASIRHAADTLGLFTANIRRVIVGKYRHTGGFVFRYLSPVKTTGGGVVPPPGA